MYRNIHAFLMLFCATFLFTQDVFAVRIINHTYVPGVSGDIIVSVKDHISGTQCGNTRYYDFTLTEAEVTENPWWGPTVTPVKVEVPEQAFAAPEASHCVVFDLTDRSYATQVLAEKRSSCIIDVTGAKNVLKLTSLNCY